MRVMVFVDGTNFLIEMGKHVNADIRAERPDEDALNIARIYIQDTISNRLYLPRDILRVSWYGSYQGDESLGDQLRTYIHNMGFNPVLFKKRKDKEEKGVDVALTKDMLVNAFNRNFDIAILVAGDEDYVQLVQEAKRYGGLIYVAFFNNGLSPELRLASDRFIELDIPLDERTLFAQLVEKIKGEEKKET